MCPGWTRTGWLGISDSNSGIRQEQNPFELAGIWLKLRRGDSSRLGCGVANMQLRKEFIDMIELDGQDLRREQIEARKAELAKLLRNLTSALRSRRRRWVHSHGERLAKPP